MSLTAVTLGESAFTRPKNRKEPTGSQSATILPRPEDWGILVVFWGELNLEEDQLRRIFTNRIVKVEGDQAEVLFEKIWPGDVPTGIEFSIESLEDRFESCDEDEEYESELALEIGKRTVDSLRKMTDAIAEFSMSMAALNETMVQWQSVCSRNIGEHQIELIQDEIPEYYKLDGVVPNDFWCQYER